MSNAHRLCLPLLTSALLGLAACGGGSSAPSTVVAPAPAQPQVQVPVIATRVPVPLTSGIIIGAHTWPKGASASGATGPAPMAGVGCLVNENYHIHAHVSIFKDGVQLAVPADIGLRGCAFEVHTHDESGIVHVETNVAKTFTLGQFFALWGQELTATSVAGLKGNVEVYVIDEGEAPVRVMAFGSVELVQHREISIVIGTRPASLPTYTWTGGY